MALLVAATPARAAGPLVSGTTNSGTFAGPTFRETWTFEGTAGDRVLIGAVTTSGIANTFIRLKLPGGALAVQTSGDRVDHALTATGTYTLEIEDQGVNDAGTYSLGFLNVTAGPLTSGADGNGGPATSAASYTGTIGAAADFDAFTFSGTAGDRVILYALATAGASFNTTFYLYPPGGGLDEEWTSGDRIDWQLQATGTYTVVIEDGALDHTGSYAFSFVNVTAGPLTSGGDADGGTLVSGENRTGTSSGPGDIDAWRISGASGDRVIVAAVATSALPFNTTLAVYPPGGGAAISSGSGDRRDLVLGSGEYTVVIEDSGGNDAGSYRVALLNVTAGPHTSGADADGGAFPSAEHRSGQMHAAADFDAWTFSGAAGSRVLVSAIPTGGGALDPVVHLYPPGGGAPEATVSTGRLDHVLLAGGTYTVVIEDTGLNDTGAYTLCRLDLADGPLVSGPDPDGGAIASATAVSGGSQLLGDFDAWRFSGLAGQRVVFGVMPTGGASYNPKLLLYPPGGGLPVLNSAADRHEIALPENGTYTAVIEDNALDHTGSYRLSFMNLTAGPLADEGDPDGGTIASGALVTGQVNAIADFDAFTFQGGGGSRVLVTGVATSGASMNVVLRLYPPGGGAAEAMTVTGRLDHRLVTSGPYRLVVEDNGLDHTGSYAVSLLDVTSGPFTRDGDADGGVLVSGDARACTIAPAPDLDGWHFGGNAGDQVSIQATATSGTLNTSIHLYPPGGGAATASTAGDVLNHTLGSSGIWTVVVHDNGLLATGGYTVTFTKNGSIVGVEAADGAPLDPLHAVLAPAAPMPFAAATRLAFSLPAPRAVRLVVHDAAGARVRVLADGTWPAGLHRIAWDGRRDDGGAAPPGVYFARLEAGSEVRTQRLVRVR